jgi:hypothetical protein
MNQPGFGNKLREIRKANGFTQEDPLSPVCNAWLKPGSFTIRGIEYYYI